MKSLALFLSLLVIAIGVNRSDAQQLDASSFLKPLGIEQGAREASYSVDAAALRELDATPLTINALPTGLTTVSTVLLKRRCERLMQGTDCFVGNTRFASPQAAFYEGSIEGEPNSKVWLSTANGFLFYSIKHSDGTQYTFGPSLKDHSVSILLRDEDLIGSSEIRPFDCKTSGFPSQPRSARALPGVQKTFRGQLLEVEYAVELDSLFYVFAGNNDALVSAYVASLYSMVSALLEDEVGVTIHITFLKMWPSGGPYHSGGNAYIMMDTIRAHWQADLSDVQRDAVHVMTSISYGGGGFAYYSLCDPAWSYGVSSPQTGHTYPTFAFTYDSYIVAHEMGHNFGAPHSHDCFWAPPLDTCWTKDDASLHLDDACYSKPITPRPNPGTIMSYCANANYALSGNDFSKFKLDMQYSPRVAAHMRETAEKATCLTEPLFKTLILTEPRGGTTYQGNDTVQFVWLEAGVSKVLLEYSTDGMKNWTELWRGTSTDGSHPDVVPNIASQKTWFRVSDPSNPEVADTSLIVSKITRTLGVESSPTHSFSIHPNPVSSLVEVALSDGSYDLQLFDVTGARLYHTEARESLTLDVSGFPSGVYSLRVIDHAGRGESTKILVHH